ncbi:F-box protein CPR1-like isoform X2 [Rhododendron vialii]|uniref:F-box protein CPR1-like isoform X2 n=1 Tax=Rhododendron vialii TaxID=182163 RepID=UPI00265D7777|nr:F-box protein CPR1-like isoform X2 [Rhododendron vialii]
MESPRRSYAEVLTSAWPSSHRLQMDIPEEIVVEILSRLPIKSLLRFRSVSQAWRSAVSDPKFTLSSPNYRQIASRSSDDTLHSINRREASSRDLILKPMISNNKNFNNINILGSCNGLLLVSQRADLYLWNPSTGECTKMLSLVADGSEDYHVIASSGLCYDSLMDDYKAVMVNGGLATIVSFKRRNWTTKICLSHGDDGEVWNSGPLVNGKLHWMIAHYGEGNMDFPTNWIVCFDPLTDEFVELPMPPNNGERNMIVMGLGVLDGCLCMTRCVCESGDGVEPIFFEVLVMEEYCVEEPWTSAFIMSKNFIRVPSPNWDYRLDLYGTLVPFCFTTSGEVLIMVNRELLLYNPNEMSQRRICIPRNHFPVWGLGDVSYAESLSSPATYAQKEDWIVEGFDALNLVEHIWCCDSLRSYGDWDSYNFIDEEDEEDDEGSIEEENNRVWKGFWKKDENQEKFCRKQKARLHYLSAKQKEQEVKHRTITKSKIRTTNNQKKKQRNNLEALDLHKQVLDFFVK